MVSVSSDERLDVETGETVGGRPGSTSLTDISVPPRHAVTGIARADGSWWALARNASANVGARMP